VDAEIGLAGWASEPDSALQPVWPMFWTTQGAHAVAGCALGVKLRQSVMAREPIAGALVALASIASRNTSELRETSTRGSDTPSEKCGHLASGRELKTKKPRTLLSRLQGKPPCI
jgi:hypothetical protein